ncbi:MAG: alpha/beta fold hydrolase [Acidobacteria bacterium]|nr:alpha/beta fold hydrolase [Acidobacteriota bacterium]
MPRPDPLSVLLTATATLATAGGCSSPAPSQPSAGQPAAVGRYDARAFYTTTSYGLSQGYAWSPDDKAMLAHADTTGIFNAYAIDVDGGDAQPLTSSTTDSTFAVSWFPDDRRALVTADRGGNEISHLFVREASGELRDLTPGDKTKAEFAGWTVDGQSFHVLTNGRDARSFDLYRYAAKDYTPTLVFRNDQALAVEAVSPDGRYVALGKPRTSADSDVYLLDLRTRGAKPQLITAHKGNVQHGVYEFARDSRHLIYATDEHGEFTQAWTYDIASGGKSALITADWDVSFVTFSESGAYRVSGINADARTAVRILDTRSGNEVTLRGLPPGDVSQVRFSRDEKKVALMLSSDTSPNDVYVVDLAAGRSARLTRALNPDIREADLVASEVVRYKSFDGREVPSILYKPRGASASQKVPALVMVHGGPGGQSRTGYSAMTQHLANHGYAVLAANNRGSSGYGKTFYHLDDKRHGEVDLDDIVHGRNYLASLDWVDADRIGIIGGSYGGYMVGAALAFRPDVFDVGVNIFGVMNWVRTLSNIPPWWAAFKESLYDEMGDPATDGERHRRISPLFHARNIRAPLLVVQGANDPRVLQAESDEIVAAVKANGVPVEYVLFPDEGHGFTKRDNRIKASDAYVGFLDTHLKAPRGRTGT